MVFKPQAYTARMTYEDFQKLCHERRSVRYFNRKPVTKEEVLQLLELARLSPSVENTQPWHFHVIMNEILRTKLMDASCYGNFVAGAGAFIVVTCDRMRSPTAKTLWNPRELEYSCIAAMEHILLGAAAMGIGGSWISLHHGPVHALLKLSASQSVIGGIMLGCFRRGEEKASTEHDRRPLEEIYTMHD